MLRIHNSLTGQKEEFKPLRANEVRMYVCGMTVYDYIHIGQAATTLGPMITDAASLKTVTMQLLQNCNDCHKNYRAKIDD